MTQNNKDLNTKLIQPQQQQTLPAQQYRELDLKKISLPPQITLTGLSLAILCPILLVVHLFVADIISVPFIEYGFVTLFVAFLINYFMVIRKYQILPFLPDQSHDNKLKLASLLSLVGILATLVWGWNGSGGIIFAMLWEKIKGNKMGTFKYLYLIVIIGSLIMEKHFTLMKIIELIPGILFGIANSMIFTLKESNTFVLTHQFIFFGSICIPVFFPLTHLVVPNLLQWAVMIVTGISMYFTFLLTVKLMQKQRVSIVMTVMSGLVTVGTSSYFGMMDFIGAGLILFGIIFIFKKEFLDLEF